MTGRTFDQVISQAAERERRRQRTFARRRWCVDCHEEWPPDYMVRDRLWFEARMTPRGGCLCFTCLEKRLGRELVILDFPPGNIANKSVYFGYRLAERLLGGDRYGKL